MSDSTKPLVSTKPTLQPTLVIGIGGTGTNVIRQVKRRFRRTWGDTSSAETPELMQVLAIDTEPNTPDLTQEPLFAHEYVFMGQFDGTRLVQNRRLHAPYLDWWQWSEDRIQLGYIHNGAKQMRPVGRLAFVRNYQQFKTVLERKLLRIRTHDEIARARELGFPVEAGVQLIYIVASVCGGTGAGMVVDVARVVRSKVGPDTRVIGVLLLPSNFRQDLENDLQLRRIQANAYAVMKELDAYQRSPLRNQFLYPGERDLIPRIGNKPFDQVFLQEVMDEGGVSLQRKSHCESMVAQFIHLSTFSHASTSILRKDVNVADQTYSTFGVSSLVLPANQMIDYLSSSLVANVCEQLGADNKQAERQGWISELLPEWRANIAALLNKVLQSTNEVVRARTIEVSQAHGDIYQGIFDVLDEALTNELTSGKRTLPDVQALMTALSGQTHTGPDKGPEHWSHLVWYGVAYARSGGGLMETVFNSPRAQETREINRVAANAPQLISAVLKVVHDYARAVSEALGRWRDEVLAEKQAAITSCETQAARFSPIGLDLEDSQRNTIYDLETSVIGLNEWESVVAWADKERDHALSGLVSALSEDVAKTFLDDFLNQTQTPISTVLTRSIDSGAFRACLDDARKRLNVLDYVTAVDRTHPAFRPAQLIWRARPHNKIDADEHNFAAVQPESVKIVVRPTPKDPKIKSLIDEIGQYDFVTGDDPTRIDVCSIQHGIPLDKLPFVHQGYWQYWGWAGNHRLNNGQFLVDNFDPSVLHSQRDYVLLDEIAGPLDSKDPNAMRKKADVHIRVMGGPMPSNSPHNAATSEAHAPNAPAEQNGTHANSTPATFEPVPGTASTAPPTFDIGASVATQPPGEDAVVSAL